MSRIFTTLAVVGALLFSAGSAWADWDDGFAAYQRGDYETAYREFLPLAEQGHPQAQSLIQNAVIIVIRVYAKTNVHQLSDTTRKHL